nr:hypothetical protein [Tanacetum cinerariifolium]GFB41391.1 hypothetical protein [Tanacetum cinerariifolium]
MPPSTPPRHHLPLPPSTPLPSDAPPTAATTKGVCGFVKAQRIRGVWLGCSSSWLYTDLGLRLVVEI